MELAIRGSNLVSGYPVAALDKTAIRLRVDKTAIFVIIPHDQFISGRAKLFSATAGPMAEAQWPFYQGRSNRMARPLDFIDKLHFRYYPARSVYQRPGQAILSKSRPNAEIWKSGHLVASALIKRPLSLALIERPLGLLLLRIAWPGR